MLIHQNAGPEQPARVVVLGAGGVLGKPLLARLRADGIATLGIGSADIDLQAAGAAERLQTVLRADDAVVFLSALTPRQGPRHRHADEEPADGGGGRRRRGGGEMPASGLYELGTPSTSSATARWTKPPRPIRSTSMG